MGALIAGLALIGLLAAPAPAQAQAQSAAPAAPAAPTISVTGTGSIEAVPDMAMIILGVSHEAESARAAMDAVSAAMAAVLARLAAEGIEARDIRTEAITLDPPRLDYAPVPPRAVSGFVARNSITVRVRALDSLGGVLDAALADGANSLRGLAFGVSEPGPLLDEARRLAVADARHRAEVLAAAAGLALGPVLEISEGGAVRPMPMMRAEAAMASAPVPIAEGEVSLSASVSVLFALAPN